LKSILLAIALLALGGCAALECDTNWYETGRRDGLIGIEPQTDYYNRICKDELDLSRYLNGWHAGAAMRPRDSAF
jgi:hypothetical protein